MKSSLKFLLLFGVIALTILACAIGGDNDGNTGGTGNTGASILFEDDFSSSNSGWDQYSDADGVTDYANGAYKISVTRDTFFYWANPYRTFDDVIVEVEAQMTSSNEDVQFGIICRHLDVNNWYVLIISADGYAAIRERYQGGDLEFLVDFVEAPMVNTGNATNRLRAECVGNRLSLYVNGELAVETTNSDISSGDVGLLAGTFSAPSVEVLFDNFVVYKP